MKPAALCSSVVDSHADGLRVFGDLPEGEEQADLLTLVQEQGLAGGLGFQESLQSLDGLFHLAETLKQQTNSSFLRTQACYCELASLLNQAANANYLTDAVDSKQYDSLQSCKLLLTNMLCIKRVKVRQ